MDESMIEIEDERSRKQREREERKKSGQRKELDHEVKIRE